MTNHHRVSISRGRQHRSLKRDSVRMSQVAYQFFRKLERERKLKYDHNAVWNKIPEEFKILYLSARRTPEEIVATWLAEQNFLRSRLDTTTKMV